VDGINLKTIIEYFVSDPLRILYFFGGTSGIWYWFNQWRDRIRLRVQVINERREITDEFEEQTVIRYKMENIGSNVTSIKSTVVLTGYTPKRELRRYEGKIDELERDLQPHKPKLINVRFKYEDIEFLLLRTYCFRLTRGFSKSLRVWSASQRIIGHLRFCYAVACLKLFGKYNEPS